MKNFIPLLLLILVCLFWETSCTSSNSNNIVEEKSNNLITTSKKNDKDIKPIKVDSSITLDYLMGNFEPKSDDRFMLIASKHSDRSGLYLRSETYKAFLKMFTAAEKEGIKLIIKSATRNFQYQKGIWERKWNGVTKIDGKNINDITQDAAEKANIILQYSSMPGTSRHHWGTDFDLNAFNNSYFEKGKGLIEYEWLVANAGRFGFCQPYTQIGEDRPNGYQEEKWHWSFMPLSTTLTEQARLRITDKMIQGFEGAFTAQSIQIVDNYILGINSNCLH